MKDKVPGLWLCHHSLPSPRSGLDLPRKAADLGICSQVTGINLLQLIDEMLLDSLLSLDPFFVLTDAVNN